MNILCDFGIMGYASTTFHMFSSVVEPANSAHINPRLTYGPSGVWTHIHTHARRVDRKVCVGKVVERYISI